MFICAAYLVYVALHQDRDFIAMVAEAALFKSVVGHWIRFLSFPN